MIVVQGWWCSSGEDVWMTRIDIRKSNSKFPHREKEPGGVCDVNKSREKEIKALAVKNGARMAKNGWPQWMTEGGTRIHITHEGEKKKRAIEIPGRGVER